MAEHRKYPGVHYCGCGIAIGDGDYASGHRLCVPCRRSTRRRYRAITPRH